MNIFDHIRSANIAWYTQNPILILAEDELAKLAAQANLTVAELRQQATTPNIRQTCPLCGGVPSGPQTHLVGCKGCGGDAFGFEFEMAHPADADGNTIFDHLRAALGAALADIATDEQITATIAKAYNAGGCMICPDCWRVTSTNWNAYTTCPIYLLQETAIGAVHMSALGEIMDKTFDKVAWEKQVRAHWAGQQFKPEISAWRSKILDTALTDLDRQEQYVRSLIANLVTIVQD